MTQRSGGNAPRREARRRFTQAERDQRVAPYDEPHVRLDTAAQRRMALRTLDVVLIIAGIACISYHNAPSIIVGSASIIVWLWLHDWFEDQGDVRHKGKM